MTTTAIMWIGLAALALAILVVIGILCSRAELAQSSQLLISGWLASDDDGSLWFYGLRPYRDYKEGTWQPHSEDDSFFAIPDCIAHDVENPPKWDDMPVRVSLWMTQEPDTNLPGYPGNEDTSDELF